MAWSGRRWSRAHRDIPAELRTLTSLFWRWSTSNRLRLSASLVLAASVLLLFDVRAQEPPVDKEKCSISIVITGVSLGVVQVGKQDFPELTVNYTVTSEGCETVDVEGEANLEAFNMQSEKIQSAGISTAFSLDPGLNQAKVKLRSSKQGFCDNLKAQMKNKNLAGIQFNVEATAACLCKDGEVKKDTAHASISLESLKEYCGLDD